MKYNPAEQLGMMWNFLKMGNQKANIPLLKEYVFDLIQLMTQKTAGQKGEPMSDLIDRQAAIDALVNCTNCGDEKTLRAYVAKHSLDNGWTGGVLEAIDAIKALPSAQPEPIKVSVDREMTEEELKELKKKIADSPVVLLPSAQPDPEKYEYHYDHTDCIWYRPEARNRCPVTCAQYRDGWNDAMNYIFRDGKGYMPYRRDEKYEG